MLFVRHRNALETPPSIYGFEICSAYTTGALPLRLTGKLAASTTIPGAMVPVNLSEEDAAKHLEKSLLTDDIHIACVNSPFNVTLSGEESKIDMLKNQLDKSGIFGQKSRTGVVYHSPTMQQISEEYLTSLGSLKRGDQERNETLMVSSVTGERISTSRVSEPQYWVENLVSPVRFVDALQYIVLAAPKVGQLPPIYNFLEVGPHGALRRRHSRSKHQ